MVIPQEHVPAFVGTAIYNSNPNDLDFELIWLALYFSWVNLPASSNCKDNTNDKNEHDTVPSWSLPPVIWVQIKVTPTGYAQALFIQNAFDGGTVLSLDTDFLPDHPLVSSQYSGMAQMIHPPNNNQQWVVGMLNVTIPQTRVAGIPKRYLKL